MLKLNSNNPLNKNDVVSIEVVYFGGKKREFTFKKPQNRNDVLNTQVKLLSYANVFTVNCYTTTNSYF